jgi:putative membrane protein
MPQNNSVDRAYYQRLYRKCTVFYTVGLGALLGMFLLARPLSFFLEHYEAQVLWGFVGCIVGTLPALWKEAGKKGRQVRHYIILALSAAGGFCLLFTAAHYWSVQLPLTIVTWLSAGGIIALGVLIPGMSPSNFLVYLGMYKPMIDAFKTMDGRVLLPLIAGAAICLFSLSALIDIVLKKMYAGLFHFIIGIVAASTVMIIPVNFNYLSLGTAVCAAAFVAGIALALWMSNLEEKYKQ